MVSANSFGTHFVMWSHGHWYPCIINSGMSDGKSHYVKCPGGDEGVRDQIISMNGEDCADLDDVIAYWPGNNSFAYAGKINGVRQTEWWVDFAGGDKGWIAKSKVWKRVLI